MAVPYAEALGTLDPVQVIAATPARLALVLARVSPEQAEISPAPGKWSLREIMAHLADCEIAWAWRLRQASSQPHSLLQPFDQDAWARFYAAYTLEAAKATFFALRAWNVALVGTLSLADRERPVTHPERGEETLGTLVQVMAGHDLHHLATLEAL